MAAILSAIALYLMVGVLAAALVFSGPEKDESYIDVSRLVFIVLFWPVFGAWYSIANFKSPYFRNPFWRKP